MYLSCLLIDLGSNPDRPRPGRRWLRNAYHVHQRLCMAFPSASRTLTDPHFLAPYNPADFAEQVHAARGPNTGFLYRIDPLLSGNAVILVQSAVAPNWDYAFHNASYLLAAPPDVREFRPCVHNGEHLRFRLQVNPTRKICTKTGPDGVRRHGRRVLAIQAEQWLPRRGASLGLSVLADQTVAQRGYVYMRKPDNPPQHLDSIRYDGVLEVTDSDKFRKAVESGIGPGKAFGFGLLSFTPI
ncbi:MAG: hypothetical protein AMXMBFR61_26920 [Fimbriimonadales bacterium]